MPSPSQAYDFEIQQRDGSWLGLMLTQRSDKDGKPTLDAPKLAHEVLAAADDDLPISKRLIPEIQEDWSRGVGLDYNIAPGVYTRTEGYAMAAGKPTELTLNSSNNSNSRIAAMLDWGGSLWMTQIGVGATANTARVLRSLDRGQTWLNSLNLPAGQYMYDLVTFPDPTRSGSPETLYATSSDDAGNPSWGRMHRLNSTTGAWTSTPLGTFSQDGRNFGRGFIKKVMWTDRDGISAWRLVVISGGGSVSYTIPEGDPMAGNGWVEGLRVPTAINALRLAATARHVYLSSGDNVWDISELGDVLPLTSYGSQTIHGANGLTLIVHEGSLISSFYRGLDKIVLGTGAAIRQEAIGQCAPGWNTPSESRYRGWCTALAIDQGWVVAAMHNPSTGATGIFWGKSRESLGIDSKNPYIWHGPEITFEGGWKVTEMLPVALEEDKLCLQIAVSSGAALADTPPRVFQVSIPVSGSPLQDMTAGGKHRFAPGDGAGICTPRCELELLPEGWDDRAAMKFLHEHTVVSRGLSVTERAGVQTNDGLGTKMVFYDRADPDPGSQTWPTDTDVLVSPAETIMPSDTVVEGHQLGRKLRFLQPYGTANPPKVGVLDAIRTTAWRAVPSFHVVTGTFEFGAGVVDLHNRNDLRDPDDVLAALYAVSQIGRTQIRDRRGRLFVGKVEQVADGDTLYHEEPPGKSVKVDLELTLISRITP